MPINRREALAMAASTFAAPFALSQPAPSGIVRHAGIGAGGMALTDLLAIASHKQVEIVAVADVDAKAFESEKFKELLAKFPKMKLYGDWRKLLAEEKALDSVNVSTPDHMHAAPAMTALQRGLAVYCQKPLTRTLHECRTLAITAERRKLVTQMGIQMHSHHAHRTAVALVQSGVIGPVSAVHCWMGKGWGDPEPPPDRTDTPPEHLDWDGWLGVAAERPFIGGHYYHPANWRKRLDFGLGTLGDMACHILDPVFTALGLGPPETVLCTEGGVNEFNWGLDNRVEWQFPGTERTTESLAITWCDGALQPPDELFEGLEGKRAGAGSIYVGTKGRLYSPAYSTPKLLPADLGEVKAEPSGNHWHEFIDAVRGAGRTSTPFSFAGPLTEAVLLGCLAQRFPKQKLAWNTAAMKIADLPAADRFIRSAYRAGWEVPGL